MSKRNSTASDPNMDGESHGRQKKKLKLEARKQLPENKPTFHFNTLGFKGGRHVTVKELRELVLYLLIDGSNMEPAWLTTRNKQNIEHVVVLLVPGLTQASVNQAQGNTNNMPVALNTTTAIPLPVFSKLFSHYCPTKAAGDRYRLHSSLQTFVTTPLAPREKEKRQKQRQADFEKSQKSATAFLVNSEAMEESLYPMPKYSQDVPFQSSNLPQSSGSLDDWRVARADDIIQTPQSQLTPEIKLFGVDCEMSADGGELARISVVDQKGAVLLDMLAKPNKPITDYATRYSGMTEARLRDVKTTLEDVQAKLAQIIDYNTILVGHSLDCDLRALKIAHPWVIDTALLYQHPRGPPLKPSLKWLAQKWLSKEVQVVRQDQKSNDVFGHDSIEDAQTAIELVNLKVERGPNFGEFVTDQEIIFERFARCQKPITTLVVDHGTPQWHAAKATQTVSCANDQEVLESLLDKIPQHRFSFARFQDLSHALGWSQPANLRPIDTEPTGEASPAISTEQDSESITKAYSTLNTQIEQLYEGLPPRSALIIFNGHGDPRPMAKVLAKKNNFDRLWKTGRQAEIPAEDKFTESDDRLLLELTERCRMGMSFFAIR